MKDISNETKEISEGNRFTTKFSADRVVRIGIWPAIWIVASAFLAGFGGSMFVKFNVALSIPGRVDAIEKQVTVIQTKFMPLDLSLEKWKQNQENHQEVEKKLDQIEVKIDNIRNLIK